MRLSNIINGLKSLFVRIMPVRSADSITSPLFGMVKQLEAARDAHREKALAQGDAAVALMVKAKASAQASAAAKARAEKIFALIG